MFKVEHDLIWKEGSDTMRPNDCISRRPQISMTSMRILETPGNYNEAFYSLIHFAESPLFPDFNQQ